MIQSKNPVISVIVPVYNTASYLQECLDSILKQDYKNFELILIDDGSKDKSPIICDTYATEDSRVKVIHKRNGGVSSARNAGIINASGKYIVFIDSDDYVEEHYLSELISAYIDNRKDGKHLIVYSDYLPFSEKGFEKRDYPNSFFIDLNSECSAHIFSHLVWDFRIFGPYCKLYETSVIKEQNLRFDQELKSAEDFDFNIRYLKYMDQLLYIPSKQYKYRVGYKEYVPSNNGVLGKSEIKSVHIMIHGIVSLAERFGIYEIIKSDIDKWAAQKHYFNRMNMLFRINKSVSLSERKKLYDELISDYLYRTSFKRGIQYLQSSGTKKLGIYSDHFLCWYLVYKLRSIRSKR